MIVLNSLEEEKKEKKRENSCPASLEDNLPSKVSEVERVQYLWFPIHGSKPVGYQP